LDTLEAHDGGVMLGVSLGSPLVMLFIVCLILFYPLWRIVKRTGHRPWWCLLVFVPVVNMIGLWILAFRKWPGVIETPILYGYPEEWNNFATTHLQFTRRFVNIEKAIDIAFLKTYQTTTPTERTIYFLGRLGVEEFLEVLLLCGNGYGIGAQKLIRAMYERAVTARYLFKHPEETDNYLGWYHVTNYKIFVAMQSGKSSKSSSFKPEQIEKIKADFEAVKRQFMVPACEEDCEKCKSARRLNYTWTRTDIVSMARADENLEPLLVPAYYLPMREFHSTLGAVLSRLDAEAAKKDQGLIFDGAAQRDRADQAIITAHTLLLNILDLQREVFHLKEMEPVMQTCFEDFRAVLKEQADRDARKQASNN
jgi:uncharacterized protein DUF5677